MYRRADLFIMPSVSEPFGIVALEAAAAQTPIIVSQQSGVKEVMPHSLVADYWDCRQDISICRFCFGKSGLSKIPS